jgi:hypothetical protein
VRKIGIGLLLGLTCVLLLMSVGCGGRNDATTDGGEVTTSDIQTTTTTIVIPFDAALLGKWQAEGTISEPNALYLGADLEFRVGSGGDWPGQLLTTTVRGITEYGFVAENGTIQIATHVEREALLMATYTIEGDTLTIVPVAATKLATATYRRVAE